MKNKIAFLILLLSLSMFINCGGENNTVTENDSSEVPCNEIATTVNWNTLPNGSYTKTQAKKRFRQILVLGTIQEQLLLTKHLELNWLLIAYPMQVSLQNGI